MHQARLKFAPARLLIGAMAIGCSAFGWSEQFQLSADPIFDGMDVNHAECTPVRVQVSNDGGATRGTVHVTSGQFTMDYPVDLPARSLKTLNVYPFPGTMGAGGVYVQLFDEHRNVVATTNVRFRQVDYTNPTTFLIGLVSTPGPRQQVYVRDAWRRTELGFLRTAKWGFSGAPSDVYVAAEEAPDRPVAYSGLKVLILGENSDRLSSGAVQAIKAWTLNGGTLVFLGGARSSAAADPRWNDAIPVTGIHPVQKDGSKTLSRNYGFPVDPFTAQVGKPAADTVIGDPEGLTPERPFGLGRAVYLAFDPLQQPFLDWPARGKFFADLLNPALLESSQLVLGTQQTPLAIRSALEGAPNASNPFQAELPSTGEVVTILALYFIAVVPLNFLVLRKLKRGELAWATAPVMSLGFAGIFFASAHSLYTAQLSSTTRALMLLQAGEPQGMVIGRTQMYFPHAGSYELNVKGMDSITQGQSLYDDYGRSEAGLQAFDDGQTHATLSVPNLAFREVSFQQRSGSGDWFSIRSMGANKFEVVNNSPFPLDHASLCLRGNVFPIVDLPAGGSTTMQLDGNMQSDEVATKLARLLMRTNGIGLSGHLSGFRAGPQVGQEIPGSSGTTIVFVSNERYNRPDVAVFRNEK